jgi:hypothetical protein
LTFIDSLEKNQLNNVKVKVKVKVKISLTMADTTPSIIDSQDSILQWYRRETMIRIPRLFESRRQELEAMYLSVVSKLDSIHALHTKEHSHSDIQKFREAYTFFQQTLQEEYQQELKIAREILDELLEEKRQLIFTMKRKKVHSFFGKKSRIYSFL